MSSKIMYGRLAKLRAGHCKCSESKLSPCAYIVAYRLKGLGDLPFPAFLSFTYHCPARA